MRRLEANSGTGTQEMLPPVLSQVLAHSGPQTLLEHFLSLSTFPNRKEKCNQSVHWPGGSPTESSPRDISPSVPVLTSRGKNPGPLAWAIRHELCP